MFTASPSEMQDVVFTVETGTQALSSNGINLAGETPELSAPKAPMKKSIYPDDVMKEYKLLVHEKHMGRLSVRQQKRLAELRERPSDFQIARMRVRKRRYSM